VRAREYEALNGREIGSVEGEMFSIPNVGTWKLTQGNMKAINAALTPKEPKATRETRAPIKRGTVRNGKKHGDRTLLKHKPMNKRWLDTFGKKTGKQ
jgi:hypothetical protein